MKHPRTLIREAVAARLAEHLPQVDARLTASRISIHRSTPLFAGKLPAILIYTRDERIEDQPNADPGLRYRKLELSVEIIANRVGYSEPTTLRRLLKREAGARPRELRPA